MLTGTVCGQARLAAAVKHQTKSMLTRRMEMLFTGTKDTQSPRRMMTTQLCRREVYLRLKVFLVQKSLIHVRIKEATFVSIYHSLNSIYHSLNSILRLYCHVNHLLVVHTSNSFGCKKYRCNWLIFS